MRLPIRKAVFRVAGLGTRFLPATKAMPKEMLTLVDRPLIQHAVDEARAAGIEQFIFVTSRGKGALEDHFDRNDELKRTLENKNKKRELELLQSTDIDSGQLLFTRQREPLGLGHAVWCARHLVGDEPFAVLLADDVVLAEKPCLKQMLEAYDEVGGNIVAVVDVPREQTNRYGILDVESDDGRLRKCADWWKSLTPPRLLLLFRLSAAISFNPRFLPNLKRNARARAAKSSLPTA